ncbi:MAG: hypothetical protein KatS3mg031_1983 [Chitinophagales bacterium]|nr:MAG: hypothetical protein KatS3mg031_1983 [Chitinophagales bacterium]
MRTHLQNPKVLAGAATLLFVLSIVGTGILYNQNQTLSELLAGEKALTEKLTAEQNRLLQDIETHKNQLKQIKTEKKEVEQLLASANEQLSKKEEALQKMSRENKNIKTQLTELQKIREEMNKEMTHLKLTIQTLQDENNRLTRENTSLQAELNKLKEKLEMTLPRANNFRVEVFRKRKDKLTVSAKKVHTVSVTFDHNLAPLASLGNQEVFVVLKDKNGKVLKSDKSGKTSVQIEGAQKELEYTTFETIQSGKTMTIRFMPEEELSADIYTVDVYTKDNYLGSVKFRLSR